MIHSGSGDPWSQNFKVKRVKRIEVHHSANKIYHYHFERYLIFNQVQSRSITMWICKHSFTRHLAENVKITKSKPDSFTRNLAENVQIT